MTLLAAGMLGGLPLRAGDHAWRPADLLPRADHEMTAATAKTGRAGWFELEPLAGLNRRPNSMLSADYLRLLWDDTKRLVSLPTRMERRDWLVAGGLAGLVAGSSAFDGNIREESQEHRTVRLDRFTRTAQRLGGLESFAVLGLFEAYGRYAGDPRAHAVAVDGLTASVLASGLVAPSLKLAFGRSRPFVSDRVYEFQPFSGNVSFPSGHTTQAFALASVVAAHYDSWWVDGLSYGLAGVVGYSRIQQNAHFASDVLAGAVIGTLVGRSVVRWHGPEESERWTCTPWIGGGGGGLVLSRDF